MPEPGAPVEDSESKNWAMMAHLSGLAAAYLSAGILAFLGPLIIYFAFREKSPYVADQAAEALNFQITLTLIFWLCWLAAIFTCGLLAPVLGLPFVLQLVFGILSALEVSKGHWYRYPFNIRLVS